MIKGKTHNIEPTYTKAKPNGIFYKASIPLPFCNIICFADTYNLAYNTGNNKISCVYLSSDSVLSD